MKFIKRRDLKRALVAAKQLYKQGPSSDTERLLVQVYAARIRELKERGLDKGANELRLLVQQRHRDFVGELESTTVSFPGAQQTLGVSWDQVLAPLADPNCSAELKQELEGKLRRELVHPADLAGCVALPEDHSLRLAGKAIDVALTAVTSGPVTAEQVALAEISVRSPLAPWKLLIKAIACFYRREDEKCLAFMERIDNDSIPFRAVSGLNAVLGVEEPDRSKKGVARLLLEVQAGRAELLQDLRYLDQRFDFGGKKNRANAMARAVQSCAARFPDLLENLKQRIAVNAYGRAMPFEKIRVAMGGEVLKNAEFWRLYALANVKLAAHNGPMYMALACGGWRSFLAHALAEKRFKPGGVEEAAVWNGMVECLDRVSPADQVELRYEWAREVEREIRQLYERQPNAIVQARPPQDSKGLFLDKSTLFQRATEAVPDPNTFVRWLNWEAEYGHEKTLERATKSWSQACPKDPRPYLRLALAAEKRGALSMALKNLDQAEKLDRLNADLRRARLRVQVAILMRHFKQRKQHLVEADLRLLDSMEQVKIGEPAAFLAVAHVLHAKQNSDKMGVEKWAPEAERLAGGCLNAETLFIMLKLKLGILLRNELNLKEITQAKLGELLKAVASANRAGFSVGQDLLFVPEWEVRLRQDLKAVGESLDDDTLMAAARAALYANPSELAFHCSQLGIRREGPRLAKFFLLRAQAIDRDAMKHRARCLRIAITLSRQSRDTDTLNQALELARKSFNQFSFGYMLNEFSADLKPDELKDLIEKERRLTDLYVEDDFGKQDFGGYLAGSDAECLCPACRRARGETSARQSGRARDLPLIDKDMPDEDREQILKELSKKYNVPRKMGEILLEIAMKNGCIPRNETDFQKMMVENPDLLLDLVALVEDGASQKKKKSGWESFLPF